MSKTINYSRPPLYTYQTAIVDSPARFTVTLAATKCGKTASHIVWLFEQALGCKRNQSVWWIAPTFSKAKIAFDRMKVQISDRRLYSANETNLVITLAHGVKICFKTGEKPDNLYGDDVYAFVFDEFTRAREEAWHALRTTITSTGGKGKFIGNAKGKRNWGNKLAMRAKSGEDKEYEYHKITAFDAAEAGMLTKDGRPLLDEINSAKKDLPESVFAELYLAEPSEDGSNPFGLQHIAACCYPAISTNPAVCYGIDLAKAVDWTTIIGLDKVGGVCHYQTFTKTNWKHITEQIKLLPSNAQIAIDSTGVGDPIAEDISLTMTNIEPFVFSSKTKQQIMEGLAIAIQQRKITICDDGNITRGTGRIRHQLEQYEFEYTRTGVKYTAPAGQHDDDVCSLALAWHKFTNISKTGNISIW
jgi:phage FluMu gp28-like protein